MARAWVRDLSFPAALLGVALLLAACGGAPAKTSASPSATVSSSAAGAQTARCDVDRLKAGVGKSNAAMGHVSRVFQLTNLSGRPCFLLGSPGLQRLDANSGPVPTNVVRGGGFSFPDQAPARVDLAPGSVASFTADWATATGYPQGCPESSKLQITPPDSSRQLVIDISIQACPDGTIHVSPVVAGADGLGR